MLLLAATSNDETDDPGPTNTSRGMPKTIHDKRKPPRIRFRSSGLGQRERERERWR